MFRQVFKYILFLSFVAIFSSCKDDELLIYQPDGRFSDGKEIVFNFNLPEAPATRGIEYPKKQFQLGDVIHVQAVFKMMDDEDGNPVNDVVQYAAFQFNEAGKWSPLYDPALGDSYAKMSWPNTSESGTFTAYYLTQSDYLLKPDTHTDPVSLSDLTGNARMEIPDKDPLMAQTATPVPYGHTINLNFIHACAYLIIEELPVGISDEFWFMQEGAGATGTFNNAFQLALNSENRLQLEFVRIENPAYSNAVYVSGETSNEIINGEMRSSVGFFLEPSTYNNFILAYPGASSYYRYLSYDKSNVILDEDDEVDNVLEANGRYSFNIAKSAGMEIITPPDNDNWDDNGETGVLYDIDEVEEFLWTIEHGQNFDGQDYFENRDGVRLLQVAADGQVYLLVNVDFKFAEYYYFPPRPGVHDDWYEPVNRNILNGQRKFLHNMGAPFLRRNAGTIKDLGIKNANMSIQTDENYYPAEGAPLQDISRQGVVCGWNQGTIENLKIVTATLNVAVNPSQDLDVDGNPEGVSETHNIGIVAGSNTGMLNQIELNGTLSVTADNYSEDGMMNEVMPTINLGGIVGNHANGNSQGTLTNISTGDSSTTLNITLNCKGESGNYSVGGVVGVSNGAYISAVIMPSVTLNASSSEGITSFIGGVGGRLISGDPNSEILSCIITGSVTAGKVDFVTNGYVTTLSYTGGISGYLEESVKVYNCRSQVSVVGPRADYMVPDVLYGIGGVFGRIVTASLPNLKTIVSDIIANESRLSGATSFATCYIGNFAGIVPVNESWEETYAGNDIYVKEIVPDNVGVSL